MLFGRVHKPGIYDDWGKTQQQIKGYPNAQNSNLSHQKKLPKRHLRIRKHMPFPTKKRPITMSYGTKKSGHIYKLG